MARPKFVQIPRQRLCRYRSLLGERAPFLTETTDRAARLLKGRAIWHVSSTLRGGGVAEMLRSFLPYVRDAGIDTRWVVLREAPEFFEVTKRLHNRLHGFAGDTGALGTPERLTYDASLQGASCYLRKLIRPGDVVYLHDPQTAGLIPAVKDSGAVAIWRCHIGSEVENEWTRSGERFLDRYLSRADAAIFSRREYVWDSVPKSKTWILPPGIDAFSPKNQELDDGAVDEIIGALGLGPAASVPAPTFKRSDNTPGRIDRRAEILQTEPLETGIPLVAQISRWDRLKDHQGLLTAYTEHLTETDLHLALVGPASGAVSDDPEGASIYESIVEAFHQLPKTTRDKIHIVNLPMDDLEENAAMVNAIQRRSYIIVQKSLAEGFGLTVAEAMWKSKPVVASRVGGMKDQITDGESGVLIDDPGDLGAFADAITSIRADPSRSAALGTAAHKRVESRYLVTDRLAEHLTLLERLLSHDK